MNFDISMEEVNVTYRKSEALKDIDLILPAAKIYGLIGRNGAGKSTLLSVLASFRRPTSGNITIGGADPYENEILMSHISFSYEKDYSEETRSIRAMMKSTKKFRPYFDTTYAEELVERFGLPAKKPMKKLSKGMQSIATVIIGLASRAPITIFDESYSGMDAPAREIFYEEILKDFERHPRTFILSTHLVSEMDHLFEEVIFLHEGKVILRDSTDHAIERGVFVTGRKENVHQWMEGKHAGEEKRYGPTVTTFALHTPSQEDKKHAAQLGLELSSASLQDLFIHMTKEGPSHEQ
ncbi:ATP-binding cassette domain-containing protein [Salimicrobium halophilum]|uniref:ABC-2 type transport system ATP-binding protein n=1 Tax=Salimicrobium halophilum TaxID=86666 RepID=A0A1G8TT13_9BACI|nr:ABC transporter ATP-binding protein [Salimicrobium halophilum]SDJ44075.1 ABC-2 type transport system ATP-binding protein [Salimicrobium halophilum]